MTRAKRTPRLAGLLAAAVLLLICGGTALGESIAADDCLNFSLPEAYTLLTPDTLNREKDTVAALGYTVAGLKTYLRKNGILLIAVDSANGRQVRLAATQTEFSKDTVDLRGLSDDALRQIGEQLMGGGFQIVTVNDWLYFRSRTGTADPIVQYVTLCSGKLYTLTCYGNGAESAIDGLIFDAPAESEKSTLFLSVFLWVLLAAAGVTAVALTVTFIRDVRRRRRERAENNVRDYIRIKRSRW